jgi:hypothetical protein
MAQPDFRIGLVLTITTSHLVKGWHNVHPGGFMETDVVLQVDSEIIVRDPISGDAPNIVHFEMLTGLQPGAHFKLDKDEAHEITKLF